VPPQVWLLVGLVTTWLLLWLFVGHLTSVLTGWRRLAGRYRLTGHFHGTRHRFRTCRFRWGKYGHSVTVGTSADGLYFALTLPILAGHPPLFIPWADVSVTPVRVWFFRYVEFRFAQAPSVPIRVPESLGKRIAADANRAWAVEEPGGEEHRPESTP
jgi:hypothetical protein